MTKMRFSVLPVGQGTGTLIQVLNGAGDPVETALIDLGSKGWEEKELKFSTIEFVETELTKMSPEPVLDAVFLSHGDVDHINVVYKVLQKFKKPTDPTAPRKEKLTVRTVWFAGQTFDYNKEKIDLLKELKTWKPLNVSTNVHGDPQALVNPGYTSPQGIRYRALAANTPRATPAFGAAPTRQGGRSYLKNLVSLVLAVTYGPTNQCIVATGDATGLTLAACNARLAGLPPGTIKAPISSLTVPHHGSVRTTYNLLGVRTKVKTEESLAVENVEKFVTYLKPKTISVSSGEVGGYRLPRVRTIGDFSATVTPSEFTDPLAGADEHFYTAYFSKDELEVIKPSGKATKRTRARWPDEGDWYTARTRKGVFTTDYFKDLGEVTIPPRAFPPDADLSDNKKIDPKKRVWATGWAWSIAADGTAEKAPEVILDLRRVTLLYRQLLESVYPALPDERFVFLPSAPRVARVAESDPPVSIPVAATGKPVPGPRGRRPRAIP
jgi:hypothetical protein